MDIQKVLKGIEKVNAIIVNLKEVTAKYNEMTTSFYMCGNPEGYTLSQICEVINKENYIKGGLYRRMKNLIREYYDDKCEWLDHLTDDKDLKFIKMYHKFYDTFRFYSIAIERY